LRQVGLQNCSHPVAKERGAGDFVPLAMKSLWKSGRIPTCQQHTGMLAITSLARRDAAEIAGPGEG
jgi:hypothetical protein